MVPPPLAGRFLSLLRRNPWLTDRWGFHVRPINFYDPLPDFGAIQTEQTSRKAPLARTRLARVRAASTPRTALGVSQRA
jgi:hypothetical protein